MSNQATRCPQVLRPELMITGFPVNSFYRTSPARPRVMIPAPFRERLPITEPSSKMQLYRCTRACYCILRLQVQAELLSRINLDSVQGRWWQCRRRPFGMEFVAGNFFCCKTPIACAKLNVNSSAMSSCICVPKLTSTNGSITEKTYCLPLRDLHGNPNTFP